MIDLHTHILPGLDDGPATLLESVAIARGAAAAGTRAVATTSHINLGFGLGPEDLAAARATLAPRLAEEGIEVELLQGGEIAPERYYGLDDETLGGLTLGGGPYVLLECPFAPVGDAMEPMLDDLQRRGFGVLLAHPERSPTFQRDFGRLEALVRAGALAQVTTGSLLGGFGEPVRRVAHEMLQRGLVHVLASDAHDARNRPPGFATLAGVLDPDQLEWMGHAAPAAVVAGDELPERPPLPRPRNVRERLRAWSAR